MDVSGEEESLELRRMEDRRLKLLHICINFIHLGLKCIVNASYAVIMPWKYLHLWITL